MVRLRTTDDLCCELNLSTTSYNLKGINLSSIKNDFNVKVTSLDITNTSEAGTPSTTVVYLHNKDISAHHELFEAQTQKNEEQDILIAQKADSEDLSDVATSGDYDDLINAPSIPSKTSDLINDSGFITEEAVSDSTKVSKSGDTMTGQLEIDTANAFIAKSDAAADKIIIKDTGHTTTSAPNEERTRSFRVLNSDGTVRGDVSIGQNDSGTVYNYLTAKTYMTGSEVNYNLGLNIANDGTASFEAPSSVKSQITNWGFPSTKYTNITLNASGSTYTAPADGYYVLSKNHSSNTSVEHITLVNNTLCSGWTGFFTRIFSNISGVSDSVWLPCSKGDVICAQYTFGGETKCFRFYYANGE